MAQEHTVLLVGGPDSGKTNYLGRLWLAISDKVGQLVVDETPSDLDYLNQIADYFLTGHFAPHTPHDVHVKVIIPVKTTNKESISRSILIVPDVTGEEWTAIYEKREWSDEWEQTINKVTGCLIFVRIGSTQIVPPVDWVAWSHLFATTPSNIGDIPTQVVVVDWLQCLREVFAEKKLINRPRIGVIIAAYDLLPPGQQILGPDAYLKSDFPLLWQYIHANDDLFDIRVFGASIADGDFDADPSFREKFLSNPGEAGSVVFHTSIGVEKSKDITLPVVWAMGL